jgi:drug/metabolite transporter (DMT)-like permease
MKKGVLLIIIGLVCFAIASPVVKLLGERGGELGMAISFCNLLFVGNLCAGAVVLVSFGAKGILKEIRKFSRKQGLLMLGGVAIAGVYPALIFTALESTSVTNVVLLSRFEGILFGVMAWWILKNALSRNEVIGFAIIGAGVLVIVFVKEMYMFRNGDYVILIAAMVEAIGIVLSKEILKFCSLRTFLFARNFFSAVGFFIVAMILYGPHHFAEAFQPSLWGLMLIYAIVVIVIGQFAWYKGIKVASPETVSGLTMISPFLTLLFAFVLLQEIPSFYESIAIGLILVGAVISKIKTKPKDERVRQVDSSLSGG